jgi:hypothetical protein
MIWKLTSSWVNNDGLSPVGLVKLASIAATATCLLPSGPIQPGCLKKEESLPVKLMCMNCKISPHNIYEIKYYLWF